MKFGYLKSCRLSLECDFSPQGEGPFLVSSHAVSVDCGGARYSVQVVGTVGQRGDPLTVPLGLLLPDNVRRYKKINQFNYFVTLRKKYMTGIIHYKGLSEGISLPEVSWRFCADGHGLVLLIIPLEDLFALRRLQQSHTGG